MLVESFGQLPDGTQVEKVFIAGGGLSAHFLSWGAVLQDLRLDGHDSSLVLGLADMQSYLAHSRYFGATAGRYANRIANGFATIEGEAFQLDQNFLGKHLLHGGADGMGKRLWRVVEHVPDRVDFQIVLEDGHMGFPGRLEVTACFSLLEDGVLDIHYRATTDKPTLCNLAHHSYFTLDDAGHVLDHRLQVLADHYTPVNGELIPTGIVAPVAETEFDYRQPKQIRQANRQGLLLDHNFCTADAHQAIRPVARLFSPASGVGLELSTTEPGLQVYDGALLDCPSMQPFAGMALEPQIWPDSPNHAHFPQAVLHPGQTYHQHTRYRFSTS